MSGIMVLDDHNVPSSRFSTPVGVRMPKLNRSTTVPTFPAFDQPKGSKTDSNRPTSYVIDPWRRITRTERRLRVPRDLRGTWSGAPQIAS